MIKLEKFNYSSQNAVYYEILIIIIFIIFGGTGLPLTKEKYLRKLKKQINSFVTSIFTPTLTRSHTHANFPLSLLSSFYILNTLFGSFRWLRSFAFLYFNFSSTTTTTFVLIML